MKKIVLTSLAALLLANAAHAGAYVAGYTTTRDQSADLFESMTLDASVGYAFENNFRAELDVFTANVYDGDETTDLNFNAGFKLSYLKGLYDFKNESKFTPYVGLGMNIFGFSYDYDDDAERSEADFTFNGVIVAGVSYAINSTISVDLQYNREFTYTWNRFANGGTTTSTTDSGWNTFKLGIAYKF